MSDAFDYGNARVAARRSRLFTHEALERLAESGSPAAALALLERLPEWRNALEQARQSTADGAALLEAAIELHRAGELASLPGWYAGEARRLVEVLVAGLDRDRVVAILRRRRAGQDAEAINPSIIRGARLDGVALAELARQPSPTAVLALLGRRGLLVATDAIHLARLAREAQPAELEMALSLAWERARRARAAGRGCDAVRVRRLLAEDDRDRAAVREELATGGPAGASLVERSLALARAGRRIREGRRDPQGIGPVAGYVAAVDAQAVRLRVALARLAGGWTRLVARGYLGGTAIPSPDTTGRTA